MLRVEGDVDSPGGFELADLARLPGQIADVAALVPGRQGGAVRFESLLEAVGVRPGVTHATLASTDGKFSQTAPLEGLRQAVLVYRLGSEPLPPSQGGPVRFLIPNLEECGIGGIDRCTNVKSLALVRLTRGAEGAG